MLGKYVVRITRFRSVVYKYSLRKKIDRIVLKNVLVLEIYGLKDT